MREFGRETEQAMEAYVNKHFGSDCLHDCSEKTEERIRNLLKKEEKPMKKNRKQLPRWIGVIAACAVLMCSGIVVYAASPVVREYLNMLFLKEESEARLTEVPEGYTGVYTAEDLDNVRNDLYGNYILMNDIVLTEEDYKEGGVFEGGFVPIGNQNYPFRGIFNGNGYVISGLVVNGAYDYAGLFGYVRWNYVNTFTEEYDPDAEPDENGVYPGLTKSVIGLVKNLGVVDSVITVDGSETPIAHAGGIAGHGDFVVGCYTDNMEITLNLGANTNEGSYTIGGVVGTGFIVDSCWSGADIAVTSEAEVSEVYAAGVAGQSYACVTSYFNGTVDCGSYTDHGVSGTYDIYVPVILSDKILDELELRYKTFDAKAAGVDISEIQHSFEFKKLNAFYLGIHYDNFDENFRFFMKNMEDQRVYLLDPETKPREFNELSSIIEKAFPAGSFNEFCKETGLKCGYYYCYDLREDPDCTFEGFDTESIWYIADGKPRLRLFSGGTVGLSTESVGDRPRLGWQKGLFQTPIPGM